MVFCKWCGMGFSDVRNLTINTCPRHPAGSGRKHELYEGAEKSQYTCKYCGQVFRAIGDMGASRTCPRSRAGERRHEPAL